MVDDTNTIEYYVNYILILVILYFLIGYIFKLINDSNEKKDNLNLSFDFYGVKENIQVVQEGLNKEESTLRLKFLIASTLSKAMTWVKAPYLFVLYNRLHGFTREEIGVLYVIDNISSIIFGPIIGSLCDLFGRKKFCVLNCILVICHVCLRLTGNRTLAIPAQIINGLCSVLTDTVFESWLNFEATQIFLDNDDGKREKNSFLREVFTKSTSIDCMSSIVLTGIATILYMEFGIFYPFYLCIFLSCIAAFYIIFAWNENNVEAVKNINQEDKKEQQGFFGNILYAWRIIIEDKPLFAVGTIESSFKIALTLFMFMWAPLLEETNGTLINPGAIFICFMLARLLGSELFSGLKKVFKTNTYIITIFITFTGSLSFLFIYELSNFDFRFTMLIYFDGLSGIFMPLMSSLKSQMIPEKLRTTIMTFFRFPINIACIFTLFFSKYITTFQMCLIAFGFMFIAFCINILLIMLHSPPDAINRTVIVTKPKLLKNNLE